MKIVLLVRPQSACDYHRVINPFRCLQAEDGDNIVTIEEGQVLRPSEFKDADLVIFNRYPIVELETLLVIRKKYKFKIWVDIDDYWELYPEHYLYDAWRRAKMFDKILQSMVHADIITVTNKRLLRKALIINDKVKVIPNAVPIGFEQFTPDKTESTRVRFMYAGGASHVKDLSVLYSFFESIKCSTTFYDNSEFILAGYSDRYKEPALKEMNRIMSLAPKYSTRFGLPLHRYMDHYNHTDVSLAPLFENEFNTYKSNLKIIEAGCMGLPIICSNMFPFLEDNSMKNSGVFFCKNAGEWYEACKLLIDNPTLIVEYGNKLYEYVKQNYDLLKVNQLRRDIINSFKK